MIIRMVGKVKVNAIPNWPANNSQGLSTFAFIMPTADAEERPCPEEKE